MDLINAVKKQIQSGQLRIRRLLSLAIVFALIILFAILAEDVWFREGFSWDTPIILAIHQFGNPTLDIFMRFVTQTGEAGAIIIAIILAGCFIWAHRRIKAISVFIAFGGAVAINSLLKLLYARPRPHLFPPLVVESGFSFPSGHVTASTIAYVLLAMLLWENKYPVLALFSCAWVFLVAISRIYLGVHYPSDTLAAIASASLWLVVVLSMQGGYLKRMKQSSS